MSLIAKLFGTLAVLAIYPIAVSAQTNWHAGQEVWTNEAPACISTDLLDDANAAHSSSNIVWFNNHRGECIILQSDLKAEIVQVLNGALFIKVRQDSSSRWVQLFTRPDAVWPCGICN